MIVMDGMAAGIVVIGANYEGITELLADGRGILYDKVNENATKQMFATIESMSTDIYSKISRKAFDFIQDYSYERYYLRLSELMNHLVEKGTIT